MSKPKIGIVGWSTGDNSFGATRAYLHHLSFIGDVRIICPKESTDTDLDLLVLPGGKDTLPSRYGQVPGYYNSDPDQFKEAFIEVNLKNYIEAGIPIWGTCLGFQQLVVYFGGKLLQNIPIGVHGYSNSVSEGRGELVNKLIFTKEYKGFEEAIFRKYPKLKKIECCSLHHQGVRFSESRSNYGLPECLDVVAYTSDNIVEIIRHKSLPIAGGQFHVEEDFNLAAQELIKELISRSPNFKNENDAISTKFKS